MTIFAVASGRGRAGVAVVRISGPNAGNAGRALCGGRLPPPRRAGLRWLADPQTGDRIDQALVLWFPGPGSFTGEDVLELHVHGGPGVIAALSRCLAGMADVRLAEPGEFSRRAFLNGRLDLTAAEGLADLIAAETDQQRRQALRQMGGDAADVVDRWRNALLHALAMVEADIDFADEDLPEDVAASAALPVRALVQEMSGVMADDRRGERLRDGYTVAIVGVPNVGKSSLLNALARRDVAIVSDRAGTTRDVLEVHLDLGGWPVTLLDTAGLHDSADEIEQEGMTRARARAADADLRLVMVEAGMDAGVPQALEAIRAGDHLIVANKADRLTQEPEWRDDALLVSALTGQGIDDLIAEIERRADVRMGGQEPAVITRSRHRQALQDCVNHLERFLSAIHCGGETELLAEDLRLAARALARITGRIDVEDVLDVIFSEFCIGK